MPSSRRYGTSSRTWAKPKSGVSWSRYVALNTPQDRDRPALDLDVAAGHETIPVARADRELDGPARSESPRRQPERNVLEMRVEEQEVRVVAHLLPVRRLVAELVAVQEDADRARLRVVP